MHHVTLNWSETAPPHFAHITFTYRALSDSPSGGGTGNRAKGSSSWHISSFFCPLSGGVELQLRRWTIKKKKVRDTQLLHARVWWMRLLWARGVCSLSVFRYNLNLFSLLVHWEVRIVDYNMHHFLFFLFFFRGELRNVTNKSHHSAPICTHSSPWTATLPWWSSLRMRSTLTASSLDIVGLSCANVPLQHIVGSNSKRFKVFKVQPGAAAVLVWKPLDFNHCVLQVMLSCFLFWAGAFRTHWGSFHLGMNAWKAGGRVWGEAPPKHICPLSYPLHFFLHSTNFVFPFTRSIDLRASCLLHPMRSTLQQYSLPTLSVCPLCFISKTHLPKSIFNICFMRILISGFSGLTCK